MKVLHLDSSALSDQSVTRQLTRAIVANLSPIHLQYRDLDQEPIDHLSHLILSGKDDAGQQAGRQILEQFHWADTIVIGAPMYNFTVPSTLKAWIDRILVAGETFRYTENGPQGLVKGKKVIIASARGGAYGDDNPSDFQEPYLRRVFEFIGIEDISFIRAEGMATNPSARDEIIRQATRQVPQLMALA